MLVSVSGLTVVCGVVLVDDAQVVLGALVVDGVDAVRAFVVDGLVVIDVLEVTGALDGASVPTPAVVDEV